MADRDATVQAGDRVRDPWSGKWRAVVGVHDNGQVFLADGGALGADECTEVLLESEPIPERGSTVDIAAADRQHADRVRRGIANRPSAAPAEPPGVYAPLTVEPPGGDL